MKIRSTLPPHAQSPSATTSLPVASGPHGLPLLGSLLPYFRYGLYQLVFDTWHTYGSPFRLRLGPQTITFVSEPDQIAVLVAHQDELSKGAGYADLRQSIFGNGLLASDDPYWGQQQRLMRPYFSAQAVKQTGPLMIRAAQTWLARWQQQSAPAAPPIEVMGEMQHLTMGIISQVLLSQDIGTDERALGEAFRMVMEYLSTLGSGLGLVRRVVPTPATRRYRRASALIVTWANTLIAARRVMQARPHDVL